MPMLLINIVNGRWVVEVANTAVSYPFDGATLDAQAANVRGFATTMSEGNSDVGFWVDAGDVGQEELAQQLFGTTDMITYIERIVFSTYEPDDYLIDVLVEAGEALLAAL